MRILLFGAAGQVGWELQRALAPLGPVTALARAECDVADAAAVRGAVQAAAPDVVVNAAAYTAVDRAESEPQRAYAINAQAPGAMAEEVARRGGWMVHFSTDYVFDGSGHRPWVEDDPPGPLSVYGASKLAGEQAVQAAGGRHLIFRTSWVYAARGNNFARTMLRLAADRQQLCVVADQWGAPTGAELLADVTAHALRAALAAPDLGGLYHLAAAGETNWCEYARWVLGHAGRAGQVLKAGPQQVIGIPTADYPTPAARPLNSRLDTARLRAAFGLHLPPWQQGVERMLTEALLATGHP